MNLLTTRKDYDRALALVMRKLNKGPATRSALANLHMYGVPRIATELVLAQLQRDGIIEQLLVIPRESANSGARPTVFALTAALDEGTVTVPPGMMRVRDALVLVAE